MAGATFSREKLSAREQILSSDAVRAQQLASRDLQDEFAFEGAGPDSVLGSLSASSSPISGLDQVPTLVGVSGQLKMTVGPGRGFAYLPTFAGLGADDSSFLVMRWASQDLTFATPDGSNPRIDLVCALPAMVDADPQSRNILVDPVARAITPSTVNKTSNPVTTLSVVTGTPGATPAPPAVPTDRVALFEVLVPASAADGVAFRACRRLWKRAAPPISGLNGALRGCLLSWDTSVDVATTSATMSLSPNEEHAIVIDGETIPIGAAYPQVFQDAGSLNPFASAAPAAAAKPYFVYLCGGRNLPQGARGYNTFSIGGPVGSATGPFLPVVLVESLVPPNLTGHPAVAITTPRGTTQLGAVYVGIGFVTANSTRRHPCIMTREMTFGHRTGLETKTLSATPFTLASAPFGSMQGLVKLTVNLTSTSTGVTAVAFAPGSEGTPATILEGHGSYGFDAHVSSAFAAGDVTPIIDGNSLAYFALNASVFVTVKGYEHRSPRIAQ